MLTEILEFLALVPDPLLAGGCAILGAIALELVRRATAKKQTDKDNNFKHTELLQNSVENLTTQVDKLEKQVEKLNESLHQAHLNELEHKKRIGLLELENAGLLAKAAAATAQACAHQAEAQQAQAQVAAAVNGTPGEGHTYNVTEV